MEQRVNQRVALTKRLVQEGLLRLLEKKLIEDINVSELCREAGINRATFYKHYYSPQDVLCEIERKSIEGMESAQYMILGPESATTVSRLEGICTYLKENSNTMKMLVKSKVDSDISNFFREITEPKVLLIGGSDRFDEDERTLIATCVGVGCYSLLIRWITDDIKKTPHEIAVLIDDVAKKGWL